jgi:uncharacterized protein
MTTAQEKLVGLRRSLRATGRTVTAFSGGVDSAFLAFVAHEQLGDAALAVTADSPSLAAAELEDAKAFARRTGMRHVVVQTDEMDDEAYRRNAGDRCYFCKSALMTALQAVAGAMDGAEVLVGVNLDDLADHRPGQQAVRERGGRWPLVDAGLSKAEIRALSKELGLPTWDKPAAACLASRLAYGVAVTPAALRRVERAEQVLRGLGLRTVRVRDQGHDLARIETDPADIAAVVHHREAVVAGLKAAGFLFVTIDLEGYRQGSHNALLQLTSRGPAGS